VRPLLPRTLRELRIRNLWIADGCVDLDLVRHEERVEVSATPRWGRIQVRVEP